MVSRGKGGNGVSGLSATQDSHLGLESLHGEIRMMSFLSHQKGLFGGALALLGTLPAWFKP